MTEITQLNFRSASQHLHPRLISAWQAAGQPRLPDFAPYTAHVLEVEVFFYLAVAANLISPDRNSNRTDIAYMFYAPFCQVFISGDKLHRNVAPHFLRPDQRFVWGPDLKSDLLQINEHFLQLPEEVRDTGILKFARHPPDGVITVVRPLWQDFLSPKALQDTNVTDKLSQEAHDKLFSQLDAFTKGAAISASEVADEEDVEMISLERKVHKMKGSWWQLPKDMKV